VGGPFKGAPPRPFAPVAEELLQRVATVAPRSQPAVVRNRMAWPLGAPGWCRRHGPEAAQVNRRDKAEVARLEGVGSS
jgi:hypothetical protein